LENDDTRNVAELYDRAKELVSDVDKEVAKLKKSGQCLSTREALNHIIQMHSREKIGSEWIEGFWLDYITTKRGNHMAYILTESDVKRIFFEKPLQIKPKRFSPVKMKATRIRNLINLSETLEYITHKEGTLTSLDLRNFVKPPSAITDKGFYCIAGQVNNVRTVDWEGDNKLSSPKPLFDQDPEGNRICNVRLIISDLDRPESRVTMTIRNPEILADLYGVKYIKFIDHFKKISDQEKMLTKLREGLGSLKLLIFGLGSNEINKKKLRNPYISVGENYGFITPYDKVFAEADKEFNAQMDAIEKEIDESEKKTTKTLSKAGQKQLLKLIKDGKATKKSLKRFAKKKGVSPDEICNCLEIWEKEKKIKVNGDRVIAL